jgi:hypothetical protein
MPQAARTKTPRHKSPVSPALLSRLNGAAMGPLAASQSALQESFKLMARRAHAYAEWAEAVSNSTTAEQVFEACTAWASRTPEDYLRTSAALAEAISAQGKQSTPSQ